MPTPSASALRGESMRTSLPPTRIEPASGCVIPDRTLISVDLPAPFSPSRQCTSPARIARWMSSLATTPGNTLVMPISSTAGASAPAVESACSCLSDATGPDRLLHQCRDRLLVGRQRHLDRTVDDPLAGLLDELPGGTIDVLRLQERDAVVESERVDVRAVGALVDVGHGGLEDLAEVPQYGRQHGALLVDRRRVPDHVDEPDLLLGRLDGLDIAQSRAVAHAEDHVGARGDGGLHHALAAGGVVIGGLADLRERELRVRVDAASTGHEAARLLEPVGVGCRDDDPELARRGLLGREHAGEVRAVLARGLDVGHVV